MKLSLSRAWEETSAILRRDGGLLAAVALALIVFPEVVFAVVGTPVGPQATTLSGVVYAAVILLGFVANISLNRLAIGPSVTVAQAIQDGFIRLVPVFVAFLIVIAGMFIVALLIATVFAAVGIMKIPTTAGQAPPASLLLLLVALTALVFAIFQLVFPIAAVETGNPLKMLSRSWQLGRASYLRLLGFTLIVFAGLVLVVMASQFGIGTVVILALGKPNPGTLSALVLGLIAGTVQAVFSVIIAVMIARIYLQLAGRDGAQASVPSSGI